MRGLDLSPPREIRTPRLVLRPLKDSDGPALAQATAESWADLNQWMRWATDRENLTDPEKCRVYAAACATKFEHATDFTYGGFLKESREFTLILRLARIRDKPHEFEFGGYWCRTALQNKGYMTEALSAVIPVAFHDLGAERLWITHAAGNEQTRRVMDKLGFEPYEIRPGTHVLPDGTYTDEHVLIMEREQDLE